MIKFFRRVRQKLLSENKFSKYLIYAIGEIILVVIGILIALQINNWNEKRQNKLKVNTLLQKVQNDIEIDIEQIIALTIDWEEKDSLARLVLDDKISREAYEDPNSWHLHYLIFNETMIKLKNSGYTNLIRLQDVIPPEYNSLLEELAILYDDHYANVIDRELRYKERTGKFEDIFFEHYDWFSSQIPLYQNTERIDFFMENVRYKGLVNDYQNQGVNNYLRANLNYALAAIDVYGKIEELLEPGNSKTMVGIQVDSIYMGAYRSPFDYDFQLYRKGNETYLIRGDSTRLFPYAPNKFMLGSNFLEFGKIGDSIVFYTHGYENGAIPFATKID
ncbi:DUF6090 family protein [Winogradskyella sp. 3972H.M.0a.05]|uniref:DUF6090 family protein n=1 Tax=Winogradskyella sp. 3972H.M.0a.05 TaxID=2950277 RepID=UPI0033977EF8